MSSRWVIVFLVLAATGGVFRAWLFEDPSMPMSTLLIVTAVLLVTMVLFVVGGGVANAAVARLLLRYPSAKVIAGPGRAAFIRRWWWAGEAMHRVEIVAWALIANTVALLVAHCVLYRQFSGLSLFQFATAAGILLGVRLMPLVLGRLFGSGRNIA